MIALLLATLAPLLHPLQEPSSVVPPFEATQTLTPSDLGDEIDRSLHWVRERFDLEKGGYGSLTEDAWALLTFGSCPRHYRATEGPFLDLPLAHLVAAQRADGSFGDPATTQLCARALQALGEGERAARIVGGIQPPAWQSSEGGPDQWRAKAREILLQRRSDGSFGTLAETASRLEELSWLQARLKASEPKKTAQPHALPPASAAPREATAKALGRAAQFLLTQRIDGGWGFDGHKDVGITAMTIAALFAVPEPRPAPVQAALIEGLDFLVSLQKPDGSIHDGQLANYVTSAAVLALVQGKRPADRPRIEHAVTFLKALQADEGEGYSSDNRYYGGVGYGDDERPDLSNLQMALEAMHTAGVPASDPAFQKAITFLQRCQNHSESNDLARTLGGKYAAGNDGGANYAPGESKAGMVKLADGTEVPRSYGSMSYALLKSYLFAGLEKSDTRVQAVWKWLRENYTLDVNPGFQASDDPAASYQGLFYYFYTMAKALDLFDEASIVDAAGHAHDWRAELCGRLTAMQRQDGSWLNENSARWFEGNPVLATSYAMLSLGAALGKN